MSYRQSIEGCLHNAIGENGLTPDQSAVMLDRVGPGMDILQQAYEKTSLPLLRICERQDDIDDAEAALDKLCEGARTLVFFGTGGSSLGGQAIAQLGGWFIPGDQKGDQTKRPRTRFYDNLDPRTLDATLSGLELERARFIVISKSGNTPETLTQFFAAVQALEAAGLGDRVPTSFLALTEPARDGVTNGLRSFCKARGIPVLDHDPGIGGRYSALSNVGLLPALARGLDARALRKGGAEVVTSLLAGSAPQDFAPALGAAVSTALAMDKGIRVHVLMPYVDRLERFADWYVQLAGESLGKQGRGWTPVAALGPVDQHSKLQLYLDGPRDHFITILRSNCAGLGPEIDGTHAGQAGADYLANRSAGDLVAAQQVAIPQALVDAGRPVRTIDLERLDEQALGGLMMHYMLETILSGHLLGVDPFDQPAVEAGKILTREKLQTRT